jgi:hypothetical protein
VTWHALIAANSLATPRLVQMSGYFSYCPQIKKTVRKEDFAANKEN